MNCSNSTNIFYFGLASAMVSDIRTTGTNHQEFITFAYTFLLIFIVFFGILSNILSIDTFRQTQIRKTTVGFYLMVYSCCSIFGLIMLGIRLIRIRTSVSYINSFVLCTIVSSLALIIIRICLWMNGFLALHRSLYSFESSDFLYFFCSKVSVKNQILFIIICIFFVHIYELISRVSIPDPLLKGNFICQIQYSSFLLSLNTFFSFTHLFIPFLLNMIANILILASISRRRALLHQTTYWTQWQKHFRRHRHLFLAPTLTIICTLPQLILSLSFPCININNSIKWLFRFNIMANLIIYIPQTVTFLIFIYPSETYFHIFQTQSYFSHFICYFRKAN